MDLLERIIALLERIFFPVEKPRPNTAPHEPVITPSEIKEHIVLLPEVTKLNVNWQKKKFITPSKMPIGLIVHYTVSGKTELAAKNVAGYFAGTPKSLGYQLACPIMSESGKLYVSKDWDILKDCNNNAGPSSWKGMTNLSQRFMGIEICNWGLLDNKTTKFVAEKDKRVSTQRDNIKAGTYEKYTHKQELALINLCFYLRKTCPGFKFENVVGHDEIAPNRKSDPGASLSMTMTQFRWHLSSTYEG